MPTSTIDLQALIRHVYNQLDPVHQRQEDMVLVGIAKLSLEYPLTEPEVEALVLTARQMATPAFLWAMHATQDRQQYLHDSLETTCQSMVGARETIALDQTQEQSAELAGND